MSPERIPKTENEVNPDAGAWSFESTPAKAMEVSDAVEARLMQLGWTDEQLGNFKLAIHEAIVNAVVHGNEGDPSKKVQVALDIAKNEHGEETAEVTIVDEGKGFDPKQVPDPTRGEELMEDHGRGAFLMKMLTDAEPEFFEGQGKVILRRKKNRPPEVDSIG